MTEKNMKCNKAATSQKKEAVARSLFEDRQFVDEEAKEEYNIIQT